jgi:hypothetical protein
MPSRSRKDHDFAIIAQSNRNRALRSALDLLDDRQKRRRLMRELAKLNPAEEKHLAEEGLGAVYHFAL